MVFKFISPNRFCSSQTMTVMMDRARVESERENDRREEERREREKEERKKERGGGGDTVDQVRDIV